MWQKELENYDWILIEFQFTCSESKHFLFISFIVLSVHSHRQLHVAFVFFLISREVLFIFLLSNNFLETSFAFERDPVEVKIIYASYSWVSNAKWIYVWANVNMDELGINRGFSPHFSPSRNLGLSENQQQQLYIHLPNHGFRIIRIDEVPDVRMIVSNLVGSMSSSGGAKPNPQYYALRLRHIISKEILWLPLSKFYQTSLSISS